MKLTVTFLNRVVSPKFGHKILRSTESDHKYVYYGVSKKECIKKAKAAMRYGASYKNEFSNETD